ncbi:hypothetical protein GSI_01940 [Ganoderma sinense ZZ0214-1]|uniref:Uncharacterized protein n=1 Tax=Ganoderma sinense ZZ0214-1 TaxID=1077348 RepID=A0A2G8SRS5_9APHY|nr:hypothetical protein GSI_01940 [Ganoderma sinense ZZ0214-1]
MIIAAIDLQLQYVCTGGARSTTASLSLDFDTHGWLWALDTVCRITPACPMTAPCDSIITG